MHIYISGPVCYYWLGRIVPIIERKEHMNVPFNHAGDLISTDALVQIISKPDAHGLEWVKRDTLVFTLGHGEDELLITARRMDNMLYKVWADRKHMLTVR